MQLIESNSTSILNPQISESNPSYDRAVQDQIKVEKDRKGLYYTDQNQVCVNKEIDLPVRIEGNTWFAGVGQGSYIRLFTWRIKALYRFFLCYYGLNQAYVAFRPPGNEGSIRPLAEALESMSKSLTGEQPEESEKVAP